MQTSLLSPEQAAEEMGISRRGVYRCIARAEKAGEEVRIVIGGTRFVVRDKLPVIRRYYYDPRDPTPEAILRRAEWGRRASEAAARSERRGRRKAERPETDPLLDGLTIRHLKAVRKFVEQCGSVEAAITAIEAVEALGDLVLPDRGDETLGTVLDGLPTMADPAE